MQHQVVLHMRFLRRRAYALAQNHADAEDLVQATLERGLRALPRLHANSNIRAWLNTSLTNLFIDHWRTGKHCRSLEAANDVPVREVEPSPAWLDLTLAEIDAGIEDLPPAFATILRLRYHDRLPYTEIAHRLDTTLDTVGTRLHRARGRLRTVLIRRFLTVLTR